MPILAQFDVDLSQISHGERVVIAFSLSAVLAFVELLSQFDFFVGKSDQLLLEALFAIRVSLNPFVIYLLQVIEGLQFVG